MKKFFTKSIALSAAMVFLFIGGPRYAAIDNESRGGNILTMYQHSDGTGDNLSYSYTTDVSHLPKMNDEVSSLRLAKGYEVILYQHGNFKGRSLKITANLRAENVDLSRGNNWFMHDAMSSFKLKKIQDDNGGINQNKTQVILYDNSNQSGRQLTFNGHKEAVIPNLHHYRFNDMTSSVFVPAGTVVTLFSNENRGGKFVRLVAGNQGRVFDLTNARHYFNDRASSLYITSIYDNGR